MSYEARDIKISVIIPFYNRISIIFETIESVLKQTYQNFELILIDDGSTENVQEIINFIKKDLRIIYLSQEHKGVSSARNLGIAVATGDYIAFLDSDDLFFPNKLEKQLKFMLDKGYEVSHTSYDRFDANGNFIETVNSGEFCGNMFPQILQSCWIATPTVMVKKHILTERNEPFNTNFHIGEDVCLYIDLAYKYEIGGIKEPLTKVHIGGPSAAFNLQKQRLGFSNIISYILNNDEYSKYETEIQILVNGLSYQFSQVAQSRDNTLVKKAKDKRKRLDEKAERTREFRKMGFYPKVSIVIPVYNGSNYMREAIESALAQTYPNIEILVINDGSTDNGETEKVALSYDDKIRYIRKENGGVATALNFGIQNMTGDYFSWLSHDDMYVPEKIEKEVRKAAEYDNPDAIIFCGYSTMTSDGTIIKNYRLPEYVITNIKCLLALDTTYTLNGCALLIPKKLFNLYGDFNPEYKYTQDYDLWYRFCKVTEYIYVDECLMLSRQHEAQDSIIKTVEVTQEADRLHYRLISDLSVSEVEKYANHKSSMLYNLFDIYRNNLYLLTSISIMEIIIAIDTKKGNRQISEWLKNQISLHSKNIQLDLRKPDNNPKDKPIIMIYTNVWTFGGLERVMKILIDYLVSTYRIVLVSYFTPDKTGFTLPESVTHIKLKQTEENQIAFRLAALAKIMGVQLFIGNPNIMIDVLPVYKLLKQIGIKSIAVNHYYYFLPFQIPWIQPVAVQRYSAYAHADAVTWCTSFGALIYGQFHKNAAVMPNPNTFRDVCSLSSPTEKIVLCVGRFYDAIKRIDRALIAFQKIYSKSPDTKLMIVGGYDLDMTVPGKENQTIRGLLRSLNIPKDSVIFVGEQTEMVKYYQNASLLLMTSDCEGFGMVLTEAGSFGLPVVMFEIPGTEDIITDGVNGFIVAQDDYDNMANKTLIILNDYKFRVQMGNEAKRLSERFSQQRICQRWQLLVETVLKSDSSEVLQHKLETDYMPDSGNSKTHIRHIVREYENVATKHIQMHTSSVPVQICSTGLMQPTVIYASPCPECINIMNSLSWKITKPLRVAKTFFISLKNVGVRATVRKVLSKIKH